MFTAFRRLECKKTDIIWMILAAALLAAGMLVWWYLPVTLSVKRDISNPYFATMDQKGNRYIINEGKSEVLKISGKGRITARIAWGDHQKDCFGEADEVAVGSDGSIYILDILWNDTGLGLSGERVLKYTSDGKFAGVVFENDYTDMMIMKRHLFSLVALKNEIRFAAVDPDGKGFSTYVLKNGHAVSALLGLCPSITYEGQAAIRLEAHQDLSVTMAVPFSIKERGGLLELDTAAFFLHLLELRRTGVSVPDLARRFHLGLAEGLADLALSGARRCGVRTVALSGGVFHNRTIALLLPEALARRGLVPLTHHALPPGDGGLSYGQAAWASHVLR